MTQRVIDPMETIRRDIERQHGVRSQRGLVRAIERVQRSSPAVPTRRRAESLLWYRANIGASGDASYLMRRGYPSSDSAWAMSNNQIAVASGGRVIGGRLEVASAEACTAGTAQLRVRVIDGNRTSEWDLSGVILDLANPVTIARVWSWEVGASYAFSLNSTLEARVVTGNTWAPTTADVQAVIMVEYDR